MPVKSDVHLIISVKVDLERRLGCVQHSPAIRLIVEVHLSSSSNHVNVRHQCE
jgi:hypothetical protein